MLGSYVKLFNDDRADVDVLLLILFRMSAKFAGIEILASAGILFEFFESTFIDIGGDTEFDGEYGSSMSAVCNRAISIFSASICRFSSSISRFILFGSTFGGGGIDGIEIVLLFDRTVAGSKWVGSPSSLSSGEYGSSPSSISA